MIWSSAQFRFARLSDTFSTGSSMMPQKRNPDAAELIRGKTGRILGAFTALSTVMKGLPLAYSKDMQEDKEPVFDAAETLMVCLAAAAGMMANVAFDRDRLAAAAGEGYTTATDLADWLVREAGVPFRESHHITGRVVAMAEEKGCGLEDLSLEDLTAVDGRITDDVFNVLGVDNSVRSRTSYGGTGTGQRPDTNRRRAGALSVMTMRWIMTVVLTLMLGLSVAACGKKPREVKSPPGAPQLPTQYPTSR